MCGEMYSPRAVAWGDSECLTVWVDMKMITKPLHRHTHIYFSTLARSAGFDSSPGNERGLLLTYPNHTFFQTRLHVVRRRWIKWIADADTHTHTHTSQREKKKKNGYGRTFVFYFTQVQCTARYMYDLFVGTAPSRPCTTFSNVLGGEELFLLGGRVGGGGVKSTLFSAQNMVRNACLCHGVSMINESHFLFTTSPPRVGPVRVAGTSCVRFYLCIFIYILTSFLFRLSFSPFNFLRFCPRCIFCFVFPLPFWAFYCVLREERLVSTVGEGIKWMEGIHFLSAANGIGLICFSLCKNKLLNNLQCVFHCSTVLGGFF